MNMRINPWSSEIPNYNKLVNEFGIRPFEEVLEHIKDPSMLMRRGIIFGHRDFKRIFDAIERRERYAVVTGMMPSGKMHLGHKMVVDEVVWFMNHGAEVYIPVADIEARSTRKIDREEIEKIAVEEYIANYIALGIDEKVAKIYFQSKNDTVKNFMFELANYVNLSEIKAIYGFGGETSIGTLLSPIVQAADILHPEIGEAIPVVVPVGADQDPHIRLARDIAQRIKFIPPSSTYHRFMTGITGEKMSSSVPKSAIFLTDDVDTARRKVMMCKTGGRETMKKQREMGGEPHKCAIFELFAYHLIEDDKKLYEIRERCEKGEIICGECKNMAADMIEKLLKTIEERRDITKAYAIVEK